ncbi:kinase-like domain-containing protein [Armillaria fumosa]|nr:kinase-like domain-containing protein [Armillaria fumosa]
MSPTSKRPDMAPQEFIGAVEDHWDMYSDRSEDYTIGSPIGFGASSIVYSAKYKPQGSSSAMPCALKVLDLDSLPPHSLSLLQRETTLMSLSKHPNVLRVRGSWMDGHKLFIALRLMNKGSAADVMHYSWPAGLEEDVIRCILRQALLGLNYLHINGFIHRDVKAANLLIDDDGTVLLGDLGVAANLAEDTSPSTSKLQTPCWMAPELIQGKNYDSSADIWSFGITALELTQGRPPRSRESPQKVLLKTIQEAPPTLDRDGGTYKYSRAFQEMLESCLVKDPSQRPTAEQLLQTQFFKGAKKPSYLIATILSKFIVLYYSICV